MRSLLLITILFYISELAASPVPEITFLNRGELISKGFEITVSDNGVKGSTVKVINIKVPDVLSENCKLWRIQTFLYDSEGVVLTGTSVDIDISKGAYNLLVHYDAIDNDMSLRFQYCCSGKGKECRRLYAIKSVNTM